MAIALVALFVAWALRHRHRPPPESSPSNVAEDDIAASAPEPPPSFPPQRSRAPAPTAPAEPPRDVEPPHENEPPHPDPAHPMTPEHQRLYAHRRLGFAMDDAADAENAAALRQLLDQYHREFPGDEYQVEAAYRLILDCLERPGAETRGAAERWLEQNNGSVVKRAIVRHCSGESGPR